MSSLTTSEKIALGFTIAAALSNLILIILLALRLKYVVSAANNSPTFEVLETQTSPELQILAATPSISISFRRAGAGLYTLSLLSFVLTFAVSVLIAQKKPNSAK